MITVEEIKQVLTFGGSNTVSQDALEHVMKQVGATEEGDISFEEFVYMMTEAADGQQTDAEQT